MLAEFRVAHPERVEHAVDPQRIPTVRLAPVGPLDNVVVIYRQPDAPQRIPHQARDLGACAPCRPQVIRRPQRHSHDRFVDDLVIHPAQAVLDRPGRSVTIRPGLLQGADYFSEKIPVMRHPVLRQFILDPVRQDIFTEIAERQPLCPRVVQRRKSIVDMPDQKIAAEFWKVECRMYVRKIGIIILRPAPQHLPGDILITEKGIIIAFEILQSLSRIAVMERKVLDQEPGRPVFQRIGLVRAVMLQNRFQFRTVFARKFQSRLQPGFTTGAYPCQTER